LTIALTPEQEKDARLVEMARALASHYADAGRKVRLARAAPGDVVQSLQPLPSPHRYPQWNAMILFGTPGNNVVLLDQWRGELFPLAYTAAKGGSEILYTHSPFAGEYDAVNVLGSNTAELVAGAARLMQAPSVRTATK